MFPEKSRAREVLNSCPSGSATVFERFRIAQYWLVHGNRRYLLGGSVCSAGSILFIPRMGSASRMSMVPGLLESVREYVALIISITF